jgi:hypothetical protein
VILVEERTIQSIPIMPFALMYACISAAIGFVVGIFYALVFGGTFASVSSSTTSGLNLGWLSLFVGVGAIIVMPVLLFVTGLMTAAITALLYNFLAPRIGGVKVRFKAEAPAKP